MILLLNNVSTHKLTTISELRQMDKQTERVAVMLENKRKSWMTLSLPANRVPTLDFSRSEGPQQHCQGFMPLGIMKLSLIIIIIIHSTEKNVLVSIVIISARLQKHKLDIHLMMKGTLILDSNV